MSKKQKTLHGDDWYTSAPCPRCKSSFFTTGQSIQIHLAWHCTMRLLWNNPTIRNSKSSTKSQDQMLTGSVQTLNQQAKQFNVIQTQVNVTLQNPLSSMPPLLLLTKVNLKDDGGSVVLPSKQVVLKRILVLYYVWRGLALPAKPRHILPF